jgi:hypothetical protein
LLCFDLVSSALVCSPLLSTFDPISDLSVSPHPPPVVFVVVMTKLIGERGLDKKDEKENESKMT